MQIDFDDMLIHFFAFISNHLNSNLLGLLDEYHVTYQYRDDSELFLTGTTECLEKFFPKITWIDDDFMNDGSKEFNFEATESE